MPNLEIKNNGISIVLGTYNRLAFLKLTIESLRKELEEAQIPSEIIVVDGGSSDGTLKWLIKQKDIITIVQHNRGIWNRKPIVRRSWGYFMNLGFKASQGKYICMVSDDCIIVPGAIKKGYDFFEKKISDGIKLGAVPFYFTLDYPESSDYLVVKIGDKIYLNHGLYLREAVVDAGYIDEQTYLFYAADADLCYKMISIGYGIEACPEAKIIHFSHINDCVRSTNTTLYEDSSAFEKKWAHLLSKSYYKANENVIKLKDVVVEDADFYKKGMRLNLIMSKIKFTLFIMRLKKKIGYVR